MKGWIVKMIDDDNCCKEINKLLVFVQDFGVIGAIINVASVDRNPIEELR